MSNYSFVSIFAFILTFYVLKGNAARECYTCSHNFYPTSDPNCLNVNSQTWTNTFRKGILRPLHDEGCAYIQAGDEDDRIIIRTGAIIGHSGKDGWCESYKVLLSYGKGRCEVCYSDRCNSQSGGRAVPSYPKTPPPTTTPPPPTTTSAPPNMSLAQMEPILISLTLTGVLKIN